MLLTSPYSISNTTIVKRMRLASVKVCECPPIRTLPSTNQIRMRIQGAYEHKKAAPFGDLLTETPSEQEKSIVKIIYYCCMCETKVVKRTVPLTPTLTPLTLLDNPECVKRTVPLTPFALQTTGKTYCPVT